MNRQQFLFTLSSLSLSLSLLLSVPNAWAQAFPSKPIKIVVPFGAGGVADQTARLVAQKMADSLGQSVIVDNRPSAGGIVAGDLVAKAEADGHTLLLMSNGTAVSTGLFKKLPFDAQKDFAPISTLGTFDLAILTAEGGKFKTMQELIAFAKANPGKLNVGSINVGSTQNLAAELMQFAGGFDVQVVPFKGSPEVITALRGGTIDAAVEILGPMMGQINSKAVRALAVMGEKRALKLPDVPTLREAGVTGATASSWNALAAPAKTPRDVVAKLNKAIADAVNSPDVKAKLADLNVTAQSSTPEAAAQLLASETKRWGEIIVRAKIEMQ
jgi:tripartite-type tricarboxylate transporter receptor subunit TctC